jgi:hypothetical protein
MKPFTDPADERKGCVDVGLKLFRGCRALAVESIEVEDDIRS